MDATGAHTSQPVGFREALLDMREKLTVVVELWELLVSGGKLWLLPLMLAMLVLGGLLVFAQTSALAPLIYTLF